MDMRRKNRNPGERRHNNLTEHINMKVTPKVAYMIDKEIEKGIFPSRSEFIRHIIINYFDG